MHMRTKQLCGLGPHVLPFSECTTIKDRVADKHFLNHTLLIFLQLIGSYYYRHKPFLEKKFRVSNALTARPWYSSIFLSNKYTLWIQNFQWLIFFVYIFLSMLSGDFLLCQTFWSKYLWIFLAIYVDYSYFDAQVRCTYLVPNMTLTLMFNRNYNNLRYSIKKIKSLLEQKFFLLKSVCEFSLKHWQ